MTVCIAARFAWDERQRMFMLCADSRLSGGHAIDDQADKMYRIGRNCVAMVAGNDTGCAFRVCASWRKRILATDEWNLDVLAGIIRSSMEENVTSPLFTEATNLEFIVTGFNSGESILLQAYIYGKQVGISEHPFYTAIGSGAPAALAMLSHRKFKANASREKAIYLVYEAKKFSEYADGVGANTQMLTHGPLHALHELDGDKNRICGSYLSPEALEHLEGLRRKMFIPSEVPPIDKFPDEYFYGDYPFKS